MVRTESVLLRRLQRESLILTRGARPRSCLSQTLMHGADELLRTLLRRYAQDKRSGREIDSSKGKGRSFYLFVYSCPMYSSLCLYA